MKVLMPLHTNGSKDLFSMRMVVCTLCMSSLGLVFTVAYQSVYDGPISQSMAILTGAMVGALCAILGLSRHDIIAAFTTGGKTVVADEEKHHAGPGDSPP